MAEIELMKYNEVDIVADFISEINKIEESNIGYCGKDSLEIAHALREDISDIPYNNSFLTVYEEGELIGVLGFDADLENNSAEIWGPFVKKNKWDVVNTLWNKMIGLLPDEINSISMFPNKQNKQVLQLAKDLSFNRHSDQTILKFNRNRITELDAVSILELKEEYFTEMKQLHDKYFPNTYYSGQQIINRLNEERKVFIIVDNSQLCGYIYVEAEPAYGEASIEFFAVKESERGKGIGSKLLTIALKWLFTIESIKSITLCVNSSNQNAISLYKKVGFQHIHELCFFTRNV
ncbi:GNAT family N-acetyltransferase [Cytobacillus solani]|uniref:GCN5 family acetyltransferase n=1 Tax=Cytobacillus solani TaxID=1637975 RepID=A0A0Q3VFI6_9BACI|nr:GNAT family N-acetyltransferase [Cytobacillus solani]KOP81276.1 GCN5 family acetyltransferase [Bacillus sp. FJAT-21945]KQL18291.1 GCN5 family acetyltransferase [Cytobacillus solani]USK56134.1 GNAT family N-acetyltransferase [Cytobacillus solani]